MKKKTLLQSLTALAVLAFTTAAFNQDMECVVNDNDEAFLYHGNGQEKVVRQPMEVHEDYCVMNPSSGAPIFYERRSPQTIDPALLPRSFKR